MVADSFLVIAAPLVSLMSGIFALFFWGRPAPQRAISLGASLTHLGLATWLLSRVWDLGPQVLRLGAWPAPYGIVYAADLMGAVLLWVTGLLAVVVSLYCLGGGIDEHRERHGFHALVQFLIFGVSTAFLTGDIFNLYVCFEILLMSSFVLMVLGNETRQLAGALKYLLLNLMGSVFFLVAVGFLYAQVGTLNFADLSRKLSTLETLPVSLELISRLLFVAFGIKAALFPLFFWLPASYHTPPVPITALFAGLLTKVGVYSLFRLHTMVFPNSSLASLEWLWWISVLTMAVGVIGAVSKNSIRKILSVHIISQVGYITLALSLKSPLALAAGLFYLVHNMVAKTGLFLVGGVIESSTGSRDSLKEIGGFFKLRPLLSVYFLVLALGLAGLPPLSGFFAKFFVLRAAAQAESYGSIFWILIVGVFTIFSMLKIWNEAFWKAPPEEIVAKMTPGFSRSLWSPQMLAVGLLAFAVLAMGLGAQPLFDGALRASEGLLRNEAYVNAVLGPLEGGGDAR